MNEILTEVQNFSFQKMFAKWRPFGLNVLMTGNFLLTVIYKLTFSFLFQEEEEDHDGEGKWNTVLYIGDLVQERRNSSSLAMEFCLVLTHRYEFYRNFFQICIRERILELQ